MGLAGTHPRVPRAGRSSHCATLHHSPAALANQGGPRWLRVIKGEDQLQEGLEGEYRAAQAYQPDLLLGKAIEQNILSAITWHVQDNKGHQAHPAGIYGWWCQQVSVKSSGKMCCHPPDPDGRGRRRFGCIVLKAVSRTRDLKISALPLTLMGK